MLVEYITGLVYFTSFWFLDKCPTRRPLEQTGFCWILMDFAFCGCFGFEMDFQRWVHVDALPLLKKHSNTSNHESRVKGVAVSKCFWFNSDFWDHSSFCVPPLELLMCVWRGYWEEDGTTRFCRIPDYDIRCFGKFEELPNVWRWEHSGKWNFFHLVGPS